MKLYFPIAIITLYCGAAIFCYWEHDWKQGTYWIAAIVLNVMVILMGRP